MTQPPQAEPSLVRGLSLRSATALNMLDMIGVGPFVTIPLIVQIGGAPLAILGWVLGAVLAMCDGMVWAELGAAMPDAGGSYQYLKEIYGPQRLGRLLSFLFIWQLTFSAPLSVASGCIGFASYAGFIWPGLQTTFADIRIPVLNAHLVVTGATFLAIAVCLFTVMLLYRNINVIGRLSTLLWVGVMAAMAWVIVAGFTHFSAARVFTSPIPFQPSSAFFSGLSAVMLFAAYDYWGYYNVCFLGAEVRDPGRNIPRALIYSILLVATLYILMNVALLGVIPWQEMSGAAATRSVVSVLMQRVYGNWAGSLAALLIMWAAFGSVFSVLLGYSRVPYAAALDGNYFRVFARVHPKHHFPYVSLLVLGAVASAFCFLRLADVIAALVVIRIIVQFLMQTIGVMILRRRRPDMPRPFRMWLYPLPALLATAGFVYLIARRAVFTQVRYALTIAAVGLMIYLVRSWRRREWPFGEPAEAATS